MGFLAGLAKHDTGWNRSREIHVRNRAREAKIDRSEREEGGSDMNVENVSNSKEELRSLERSARDA